MKMNNPAKFFFIVVIGVGLAVACLFVIDRFSPARTDSIAVGPKRAVRVSLGVPVAHAADIDKSDLWVRRITDKNAVDYTEDFLFGLTMNRAGEYAVDIKSAKDTVKPGRYRIAGKLTTPQGVRDFSQNFLWGVLAMNFDKAVYVTGETVFAQMAVLDNRGHTLCDADLDLRITAPDQTIRQLSTEDGSIVRNPACGPDNVIDEPDYYARFILDKPGTYQFKLTSVTANGQRDLHDVVQVLPEDVEADILPFIVERIGPTRVYPLADYQMQMRITARTAFQGIVEESIPVDFMVTESTGATVAVSESDTGRKSISWPLVMESGESRVLQYTFDPPNVSPEFYLLGPLVFIGKAGIMFSEARSWQIASDADSDTTYNFDTYSAASTGWSYETTNSAGSDTLIDEPTNNANAPDWQWTNGNGSPSGSTGPPAGVTCVFPESSSPMAQGDVNTMTLTNTVDAGTYALYVTFDNNMYGNTAGTMDFEAWDGSTWNTIATFNGDAVTTMTSRGPYDFTSYTNSDFAVRFVVTIGSGNAYQHDFCVDTVRIYGDYKNLPPTAPTFHDVPFDNELTGDDTPAFDFTASDPDGTASIIYQIQVDDDYAFGSPLIDCESDISCAAGGGSFANTVSGGDTSPFNEGEKIRFTPTTTLTNNTTYYWRVRAEDDSGGGGSGGYGSWSAIRSLTYVSGTSLSAWRQTTDEQFDTGTLASTLTTGSDTVELMNGPGVDTTYGFDDYATANDGSWVYESDNSGSMTNVGIANAPSANGNAPQWQWVSSGTSASSGTGPPASNSQSCIFPETSTPVAAGDVAQATLQDTYDASINNLSVTFDHSPWGIATGYSYLDAWDGTQYNVIASWAGNTSDTGWQSRGPYDFSPSGYDYTNTDFHIRLRVVAGATAYQNDFAFDTVRIYGSGKTATSGMVVSPAIDYDWVSGADDWDELQFTDTETSSDIKYDIQYWDGGGWSDTSIVDQDTSPVDISSLDPSTHNQIRIVAHLTDAGASPTLSDWTVTWQVAAGNAVPTISAVTESSDPVAAGQDLYWSVDWNDTDGDKVKVVVCSTNAITDATLSCAATKYCESPVYTDRDPEGTCSYTTQIGDVGTLNYYAFACDDSGESSVCSSGYAGSVTVEQQSPSVPSELLTENMPNPVNIANLTPIFSAVYNDPNPEDSAVKYCIEVNTQSDFAGTNLWFADGNSCADGVAMATTTDGVRSPDIDYAGSTLSLDGSLYYWRLWFWDDSGNKSTTSSAASFQMASSTDGVLPQGVRMKGGHVQGGRYQ